MIPLINVVFLILIFFLLAGTVVERDIWSIDPAKTATIDEKTAPHDVVYVRKDKQVFFKGEPLDVQALEGGIPDALKVLMDRPVLKVFADKDLPAHELVDLVRILGRNGEQQVALMTAKGEGQ